MERKGKSVCTYLKDKNRNRDLKKCHFQGELYGKLNKVEAELTEVGYLPKLYKSWGYRTRNGDHDAYELELHDPNDRTLYDIITPFSDPLMRTLEQENMSRGFDISGKFLIPNFEPDQKDDVRKVKKASKFLANYIETEPNEELLCWLASQDLREPHSWLFGAWILAARALLSLYDQNMADVNAISNYAEKCIKETENRARLRSRSRTRSRSSSRSRSRSRSTSRES